MAGKNKKGARSKLREHFFKNINRIMDSEELREIAGGISEWARRVREYKLEILKWLIRKFPIQTEEILSAANSIETC